MFEEIGLEYETANLLTRCKLPKTGIFKIKTNPFVTEKLLEEWTPIKILDKGCYQIHDRTFKKFLLPILKKQNRYSKFIIKHQSLQKSRS